MTNDEWRMRNETRGVDGNPSRVKKGVVESRWQQFVNGREFERNLEPGTSSSLPARNTQRPQSGNQVPLGSPPHFGCLLFGDSEEFRPMRVLRVGWTNLGEAVVLGGDHVR